MIKTLIFLLIILSGCQQETITVNEIWDDIPGINYSNRDVDLSQFVDLDTSIKTWGIGKTRDEKNQPVDCVNANELYGQYDATFVREANNEMFLTFDSGYENGNTALILDVLKQKEVSAVFFLTAQYVIENEDLVKRMIDEGHVIGNHTYHHSSLPIISDTKLVEEIMDMDDLMIEKFQYKMKYVRPPRGEYSEKSLAILQALGYETLFWSFGYYDFNVNDQPGISASLQKCLDGAHPGAIYLFHSASETNAIIMNDFIDGLRDLNYKISDLNEFN